MPEDHIGIVEDEPEVAKLYQAILAARGFNISFIAEDGHEAIQAYNDCDPKPSIVIMDHRMPEMTGIDAMKILLSLNSGTKYVIVSADAGIRNEAIAGGATIFLEKPIQLKQLISCIDNLLMPDMP